MTESRVYEVLAEYFSAEGVDTCFALLGDANMNWAQALTASDCRFVFVRHEHCAVAAAMAYSRSTGKVGVASVTCGPGLTQIMTALPAAVRAGIPLVIFAGEAPLKMNWYNQAIDQKPFVTACGARYVSLHHQKTMLSQIRDAFMQTKIHNIPVVVGVPLDLQNEVWQPKETTLPTSDALLPAYRPLIAEGKELQRAASLINAADKIVVMAGLGAVKAEAGAACQKLAERLGALLATTLPAKGLFYENPFCLGVAGGFSSDVARKYLVEADLIIAVGASLSSHNSDGGKLFSADHVLHIDCEPASVSQGRVCATHHLRGDAKHSVAALHELVAERQSTDQWRSENIAHEINNTPADSAVFEIEPGQLDPREVVRVLDERIPPHWYTVNSSGHCSCFFAQMKNRPASHFLTIREFGAIGNGVSFAMGVAAAQPDNPVVLFDGDGSFLMHIQELETIVRHGMNVLIVVINDGAYGSEIHKLRAEGLSDNGAVFPRSDFASIAKGFGMDGATVNTLDQLPVFIDKFSDTVNNGGGAMVIDVQVSDRVVSSVIRRSHMN